MRAVPPSRPRRIVGFALLLCCSAGLLPAAAFGQSSSPVNPPLRVRIGEDASLVVPPSLVRQAADVPNERSVVLQGGAGTRTVRSGGTSVGGFLTALGLPLEGLERLELQVGAGRIVTVSGEEVRSGFVGDPGCERCQATLDAGSRPGAVSFLRPLRGGSDANDDDQLVPSRGQTLYLRVISDRDQIAGSVQWDRRTYRAGDPIDLRLESTGRAPTQVTWFFGDGTIERGGTTARHTYRRDGSWPVSALFSTSEGFGASTNPVRVNPAPQAREAKDPAASPTPSPTRAPSPAPAAGPAGTDSSAGQPGGVAPTTGPVAPVTPSTAPATPLPPPPSPAATPAPLLPPASGATLRPIRGRLASAAAQPAALAGALTAAEALAAQTDAGPDAAPAPAEDERSLEVAGSALSGMLLVGLLSAGAFTERRRARRATDLLR